MASITRYKDGWRAYIRKGGVSRSAVFKTKALAKEWATKVEALVISGEISAMPNKTFGDLLTRYMNEVTPRKRASEIEARRIRRLLKDDISSVPLRRLNETHFAEWRDTGVKERGVVTVLRDWVILSHCMTVARKEWKILNKNYLSEISKPKAPDGRDRRISDDEIDEVVMACEWDGKSVATETSHRIAIAFLFAIETAMRAGEIARLRWSDIDIEKRVATLPMTKNGTSRRVPLSRRAIELLGFLPNNGDVAFGITDTYLQSRFSKLKSRTGIENLHFHDTRHEAITRLAKKLDVLELARMVGHKNLKQLLTYYNATAEELAMKL